MQVLLETVFRVRLIEELEERRHVLDVKCGDRSYDGHAQHVMGVRFTFDDSHVLSTGGGDRCIFQWTCEYEEQDEQHDNDQHDGGGVAPPRVDQYGRPIVAGGGDYYAQQQQQPQHQSQHQQYYSQEVRTPTSGHNGVVDSVASRWFRISDSSVRECSESETMAQQAFILFYARRD